MGDNTINDLYVDNALTYYMNRIGSFDLLTADEERELLNKVKDGDGAARDKLILSNLRLVVSVANKYKNRGIPFIDLIQEGNIGLMEAVKRFNIEKETKFSTYATWWIRQAIEFSVHNSAKLIRIPYYMNQLVDKSIKNENQLIGELGRYPTLEEIADSMDISIDKVNRIKYYTKNALSLDECINKNGDDITLGDYLEDSNVLSPAAEFDKVYLKEKIDSLLNSLTYREELVIRYRYGLDGEEPKTLDEVASIMGVSHELVRVTQLRAINKLKRNSIDLAFLMPNSDYFIKKSDEFGKTYFGRKGMDKSICKYFDKYSRRDIMEVLSMLSSDDIDVLRLKFGQDLGCMINYELSSDIENILNDLYGKIELLLNNLHSSESNVLIKKKKNRNENA